MADNETIEELKRRIEQLESEKRQGEGASSGDDEETQEDEPAEQAVVPHESVESLQGVDTDATVEIQWSDVPAESKWSVAMRLTGDYVIPFVRRQWKILTVGAIGLAVGIGLLVSVGLIGTAVVVVAAAVAIGFVIFNEQNTETKRRSRRRSYSRERQALWLELNKRFGRGNVRCVYCKRRIHRLDRTIHLDHKIPLKHGGTNEFNNMHLVHARCNERKGTTPHREWMQILARERQKANRNNQSVKQAKRPTRPGRPRK